jgi:hypothetical protein
MSVTVTMDTNIGDELDKVKELIKELNTLKENAQLIQFVSIKEFSKLTGWSEKTVQELYNRADFPATNYGKEKKAEVHAIIQYFSVPRRK